MNTPATLQINFADSQAMICPDIGGTVARFSCGGRDIFRPAPDTAIRERVVRQMGCYPLVPYSNRIGSATLMVDGQPVRLRANSPPEPHALHGFGWQREWQVEAHTNDAVELMLHHPPDADWPFDCEAMQNIRLTENALHLNLRLRNRGDRPMPAGLGFHPYFPINPETRLQAAWNGMWQMGANSLPTEHVAAPVETDFSSSRTIDGWKVDNCFTGWNRRAVLDYATHRVQIDACEACRYLVCFAPNDGRNFVALEPVTNINNAFALAAKGVNDTGVRVLAPGEALEAAMSISVEVH